MSTAYREEYQFVQIRLRYNAITAITQHFLLNVSHNNRDLFKFCYTIAPLFDNTVKNHMQVPFIITIIMTFTITCILWKIYGVLQIIETSIFNFIPKLSKKNFFRRIIDYVPVASCTYFSLNKNELKTLELFESKVNE
jgi:hypothetical protein